MPRDSSTDMEASTLLVGDTLLCRGIRSVLAEGQYVVLHECSNIGQALRVVDEVLELIIVGIPLVADVAEPIRQLRSAFPASRIVVYTTVIKVPDREVLSLFESCLDGCITGDSPVETLEKSLDLVMLGQRVFPSWRSMALSDAPVEKPDNRRTLSQREWEVLQLLRAGRTNKLIARELSLSEATVKVHVKALLRKIGVHNRTEAAVWASREYAEVLAAD